MDTASNIGEAKLRTEVAAATLLLNMEGILGYSGHVSVRLPGRDAFLIQPVDQRRAELEPDHLLVVDFEGHTLSGPDGVGGSSPHVGWTAKGHVGEYRIALLGVEFIECEGDANGDGVVDPLDSGFVLARFGCSVGTGDPDCDAADVNGDGAVDPLDAGYVLALFGPCF